MTFENINQDMFRVMLTEEDEKIINNFVNEISGGVSIWQEFYNDKFIDNIICRYVAAEFYKKHKETINNRAGFVTIDIGYNERIITISVGLWSITKDDELKLMTGVLYT